MFIRSRNVDDRLGELGQWSGAVVVRVVGRLGQGPGILAHGVARDPELAGYPPQGKALDPGVLHRFPERELPRDQLAARRKGSFSTTTGRLDRIIGVERLRAELHSHHVRPHCHHLGDVEFDGDAQRGVQRRPRQRPVHPRTPRQPHRLRAQHLYRPPARAPSSMPKRTIPWSSRERGPVHSQSAWT